MILIILVTVGICLTWPVSGETEWAGYNLNQTPVNVKVYEGLF